MDDIEIIKLFFERNEAAISETERKYGRLCLRTARNILNDESDCEECVNDAYMGLWNAIPPSRPNDLKAFLCRIVRNLSLKRFAHNKAAKRSESAVVSLSELGDVISDNGFSDGISDSELGELISEFLRREKEVERNVFIRRYWFFDSIGEIAKRYCFTESKVKSMLYHSRIRLKKFLKNEGFDV